MTKNIDIDPQNEEVNYQEYLQWLKAHSHCDVGSWTCPDEDNCPHKKGAAWVIAGD